MNEDDPIKEQGFSDWASPPFKHEDGKSAAAQLGDFLREMDESEKKKNTNRLFPLAAAGGLLAIAFISWLILQQAPSTTTSSISNSTNATIIGQANNVEINNIIDLRHWGEVPEPEKLQIKAQAIQTFPQIKDIGQGVSWQPIAEWLAAEHQIIHSNPRDLFR